MGRPKKYTERTLRKAVKAYFRRITRTITIREQVNTGEKDGWGHWIYTLEDVKNGGLCEALGIHRSTWADYCDPELHPELLEVTAWAREVIQHYLESELLGRDGKNLKGVIFSLQNNFGMSEKKTVELGPKAAMAVASAAVSMEEKRAMLEELALEFAGEAENGREET